MEYMEAAKPNGPGQGYFVAHAVQGAPVAEEADVKFAVPATGHIAGCGADDGYEPAHLGLVFGSSLVDDGPGPFWSMSAGSRRSWARSRAIPSLTVSWS